MPWVIVGVPILVGLVWLWRSSRLPGSIAWRATRVLNAELERLERAPIDVLVKEVRERIRGSHWEQVPAAQMLLHGEEWDEAKLLASLNHLYSTLLAADEEQKRTGQESSVYAFHDCGFALVCQALEFRAADGSGR